VKIGADKVPPLNKSEAWKRIPLNEEASKSRLTKELVSVQGEMDEAILRAARLEAELERLGCPVEATSDGKRPIPSSSSDRLLKTSRRSLCAACDRDFGVDAGKKTTSGNRTSACGCATRVFPPVRRAHAGSGNQQRVR